MIDYLHDKVAEHVQRIGDPGKTLEIGSYDVNGGVADLFSDYTGIDMREGPSVDLVINSHDLLAYFEPHSFDTIVWLESAEHDDAFWLTMEAINSLIRSNGHLIMSVPTIGYGLHRFPNDYWRFTVDAFFSLLKDWEVLVLENLRRETICALACMSGQEGLTLREYVKSAVRVGVVGTGTVRHEA
jgi:2-polyprenyl-3-methyl-5-hydroxy-6-metoxy-1,4-benzoquinol methylase